LLRHRFISPTMIIIFLKLVHFIYACVFIPKYRRRKNMIFITMLYCLVPFVFLFPKSF
jgi:hypothetical protein